MVTCFCCCFVYAIFRLLNMKNITGQPPKAVRVRTGMNPSIEDLLHAFSCVIMRVCVASFLGRCVVVYFTAVARREDPGQRRLAPMVLNKSPRDLRTIPTGAPVQAVPEQFGQRVAFERR
eukprot:GHVU01176432.1.p2 GENE.GHVU01176432.1~~GHVU01176432.1.p2  ORF type:complete len:120 (+),score=0.91 GHVU01176432.1:211-570(+)